MASPVLLTPKVTQEAFMGTLWGATAVSALFVVFRVFVRIKAFGRLWIDDALVLLSWSLLLATAVIWQTVIKALYDQYKLVALIILPTPEVLDGQKLYFRALPAIIISFYTCLFAVKLSFLFFFRRLGARVKGQRVWWWVVFVFNVAVWITLIGSMGWPCMVKPLEYIFTQCNKTSALKFQHRTFVYNCVIDVVTDAMIITIPALLLWNVKMPLGQKLALLGIFSLTIFVMIVSIVRVAVTRTSATIQADQTWLFLWAHVEMGVAIIISCVASFRQLFMKQDKPRYVAPTPAQNPLRQKILSSLRSKLSLPSIVPSTFKVSFPQKSNFGTTLSATSNDDTVPLEKVYVSHDVGDSSEAMDTDYNFGSKAAYGSAIQTHGQSASGH